MPAEYPWLPYMEDTNDLVNHAVPAIRVAGQIGGNSAHTFTDVNGQFSLSFGSTGQGILITSTFATNAQWYTVVDLEPAQVPEHYLSASASESVGDEVPLLLADSSWDEEYRVAQVDPVVTAQRARSFFIQYMSSTTSQLNRRVFIYPNAASGVSPCNALAQDDGTNYVMAFPRKGGGCWNNGNHSAVAHEFGHVTLYMLHSGFPNGTPFQEGFADTYGNLLNNDSVQGREMVIATGGNLRDDPLETWVRCQYPLGENETDYCGCLPHKGAPLLSGPWLRITNGFKSYYGASTGLEQARIRGITGSCG